MKEAASAMFLIMERLDSRHLYNEPRVITASSYFCSFTEG